MISRITDFKMPETLYKYRDWSDKFHRKLLTHKEIYFPKPSQFNDPFDGNIPVRWDLMTYEDCVNKNLEILNIIHSDKDQRLVRELAKQITDEKTLWHPDRMAKERQEQLEKWDSLIGLFSLSVVPDNILMWSHYSNNHEGFVVGFDTKSLTTEYDFDYMEPINYQSAYPIISGLDDITSQFYKKFFYKSELWNYEKEWRISKNHIKNRIIKLNTSTLSQIIIGCCTKHEDTKDIIKLSKKQFGQDIQLFKATKAENEFGLVLQRLE